MVEEIQTLLAGNCTGLTVLSVAVVCDIFTGIVKAVLEHDLKSSRFKDGLLKKTLDYILVVIGCSLDIMMKSNYIGTACLYCLIAMEFYSCIENIRKYIPIPSTIEKVLESLQKSGEENDEL